MSIRCKYCVLILLSSTLIGKSQAVDFFKTGSLWTYYSTETTNIGAPYYRTAVEKDSIVSDTLINSLAYKKILCKTQMEYHALGNNGYGFVVYKNYYTRYDTLTKRQYVLDTSFSGNTEELLYDFNLTTGDTMPCGVNPANVDIGVIDSVNQITIFGKSLKKFYLSNGWGNYALEGIGGSAGLHNFRPYGGAASPGIFMTDLNCFASDDSVLSISGTCVSLVSVGINELVANHTISIYPNPTKDQFNISSSFDMMRVSISNLLGEIIFIQNTFNGRAMKLDANSLKLSPGIYLVQIMDKEKNKHIRKMVVQ